VLYELLCGERPARDSGAPLRPSQIAFTEQAAEARRATPRQLAQALAGDLDTIALKALKVDPSERYATADALRQDLQRTSAASRCWHGPIRRPTACASSCAAIVAKWRSRA